MDPRERRILDRAVQRGFHATEAEALVGHTDGSIAVANRAGFVHVRLGRMGDQTPDEAKGNGNVPLTYNQPVVMRRDKAGHWVITGINTAAGVGSTTSVANHHHRSTAGAGLRMEVEGKMLEPGRVRSAGTTKVYVNPLRYLHNGAWQTFLGSTFNLNAYKPATVGHWAWVLVGLDPDTNGIVAVTGTSQVVATELTLDQLDDISFDNWIPLGAVRVRQSDTAFTNIADYFDAKGWVNQGGGGSTFLALSDTPANYTGAANKYVQVNATGDGLEFDDQVVTLTGSQTLTDKTLTTPTIGDFTNANHSHGGSSSGGTLPDYSLTSHTHPFVPHFHDYVAIDGTTPLINNWDIGEDIRILLEAIRARDTEGILFERSGGATAMFIQDSNGYVGIGTTSPGAPLHLVRALGSFTPITDEVLILQRNSAANQNAVLTIVAGNTGSAMIRLTDADDTEQGRIFYENNGDRLSFTVNGTNYQLVIDSAGRIGNLTTLTTLSGQLHFHDGTGGFIQRTLSGINSTTDQVLIPNAAGDVTHALAMSYVATDGTSGAAGQTSMILGDTRDVNVGTLTVRFTLNANGSLLVKRQAGTGSATVNVQVLWI